MKCKLCEESFDTKYRIPRNLQCGHCFCEQCLKIYQKNEEIECPKCTKKSPSKLPICFAVLELIDGDDHKKGEFCPIHTLEKLQFRCQTEGVNICVNCLLSFHNGTGHVISSLKEGMIAKEIKKDFERIYTGIQEKYTLLKNIKSEVEKFEDFLNKMLEKQKLKLNDIQNSFVNKKKEKLEELNKIIEINYLNQYELLNKLILETDFRKNYIDIYSSKIQELLESFKSQTVSEIASFNITKTEDEFRKIRLELENIKGGGNSLNSLTNSEIKIEELNIDFDPKKLVFEDSIKYDVYSNTGNYRKDNFSHILFFGDTKDKLLLLYSFENDAWSVIESVNFDSSWEFFDYSSVSSFSSGDLLLTGGCHYTNYRNTARKSTYLIKISGNSINIHPFHPLLIDRFSHGSLIIKDVPYVFGGHDGNETLSSLEYFDTLEGKWKFLSFMNIEREIFAYCCIKQRYIYVFGGFNVNHLDSIERYDIVYDKWKLLNIKMKRPLQNATAVEVDNSKIVLIGGYNGALHKCIDVLDLETKCWTSLEYMHVPRRRSHCYKYKNKIYIFGGESSESEVHIPETFDLKDRTWSELKSYDSIVSRSLNFWCSTGIYI